MEKIKIIESEEKINNDDLINFQNTYKINIPKNLNTLLLKHNGGISRRLDDLLAYKLSGISKNKNYTWHHLDDFNPISGICSMQLVEKSIHRYCIPHFGSVELVKRFFNLIKYV